MGIGSHFQISSQTPALHSARETYRQQGISMSAIVERPAEFDAKVMAHVKALGKTAWLKTRNREAADDLVSDTVILALHRWQNYNPKWAMWTWLCLLMKGKARDNWIARKSRIEMIGTSSEYFAAAALPNQESRVALNEALAVLDTIKNGDLVLGRAMGDVSAETARKRGVSRQHIVNQTVVAAARFKDLCQ